MAITNFGYDGPIDEVGWAFMHLFGGKNLCNGDSMKVSVQAGADRTVVVQPGEAYSRGVLVRNDAAVPVQSPAVASGSRWDTVVLRRDFQTNTSSYLVVTGGSSRTLAPGLNDNIGLLCDQPLALVQYTAGQQTATGLYDLRHFEYGSNTVYVASPEANEILLEDYPIDPRYAGGGTWPGNVAAQNAVGSATSGLVAGTIAKRDGSGRVQVATPAATGDAANKYYVDTALSTVSTSITATLNAVAGRVPPGYQNATVVSPFWAGYVAYVRIGPAVLVEVNLVRNSGTLSLNGWASTDIARGMPAPASSGINHGWAATNNDRDGGWAFSMTSNGYLNLVSRWDSKSMSVGTWVNGTFIYIVS